MSRSDSEAGLSPRGRALVEGCRSRMYESFWGLCNEIELRAYTHRSSGRELREVVQVDLWSGGPTWFLTLVYENGTPIAEANWTEQELSDWMDFPVGDALPTITEADVERFRFYERMFLGGNFHISWSEQEKYDRWLATRSSAA